METVIVMTYPARSRLECVALCHSCGNCTGVDYVKGEHLCHCIKRAFVILP